MSIIGHPKREWLTTVPAARDSHMVSLYLPSASAKSQGPSQCFRAVPWSLAFICLRSSVITLRWSVDFLSLILNRNKHHIQFAQSEHRVDSQWFLVVTVPALNIQWFDILHPSVAKGYHSTGLGTNMKCWIRTSTWNDYAKRRRSPCVVWIPQSTACDKLLRF